MLEERLVYDRLFLFFNEDLVVAIAHEEMLEELMEEHMGSIMDVAKGAQTTAIELTKLILQYSKQQNFDMKEIHEAYAKSFHLTMDSFAQTSN